ncbi:MAG: FKBP-type peptidyl-prolyl cis-trans isomerase [Muribaculaceae bacterium]|nr:FKBP-type peptidyl-prolyl cis-trans isomerase [Muribaculaceae bacterium]
MEKVEPGKYVEMVYDLYRIDPDGTETLVHQSDPKDPEKVIFGVTQGMIAPLEKAIEGLEPGQEYDVTVKADEAFGPYDEEQIAELEKYIFEVDGKFDADVIKKGAVVPMMTADGFRINGVVLEVADDKVKMDFNHPLAGKDVRFKGKVQAVREATPEELHPAQGCGCGCSEGSCGEGGCGEGCGEGKCGC